MTEAAFKISSAGVRSAFKAVAAIPVHKEIGASKATCDVIAQFYQGALTQMILQWISNNCETDPTDLINYIGYLFNGNIESSLKRGLTIPPIKNKY